MLWKFGARRDLLGLGPVRLRRKSIEDGLMDMIARELGFKRYFVFGHKDVK